MCFPDHLKIVVFSRIKQLKLNETAVQERRVLDATDVELTKVLAQSLKFSYQLLTPEDNEIGRRLPDGNWTGMMGLVLNGDADLVVSIMSLTEERSRVLDFSYPYYKSRITFATRKPEYTADFAAFLKPFSLEVWICVLLTIVLVILAFYKIFSTKYSFNKLLFDTFSTMLRQNLQIKPRRIRDFLLMCTLITAAMLLSNCYSAVLLSFLTFPPLSGVRTIPELATAVTDGRYEIVAYPGTFFARALASSSDLNARIIGQNMLQNKAYRNIHEVLKNTKSLKRAAFVAGDRAFMTLTTRYFISDDELLAALQVIWMKKDFCCKERLNRFVSALWSSGVNQKITYDQVFKSSLETLLLSDKGNVVINERSLTFDDFK